MGAAWAVLGDFVGSQGAQGGNEVKIIDFPLYFKGLELKTLIFLRFFKGQAENGSTSDLPETIL